jgi:hypothetical protein
MAALLRPRLLPVVVAVKAADASRFLGSGGGGLLPLCAADEPDCRLFIVRAMREMPRLC